MQYADILSKSFESYCSKEKLVSYAELFFSPKESCNCPAENRTITLHIAPHHGDELNIFSVGFVIIWILLKFEFWLGPKMKIGPEDDMQRLEAVRSP